MRRISTLIGILICLSLWACTSFRPVKVIDQKLLGVLPLYEGKVTYVDVQNLKGVSDVAMFRQARRWVAFHVRNPKDALEIGDFDTKDIIGSGGIDNMVITGKKGSFQYYAPEVSYTVTIECYPSMYRITYSSFYLYGNGMEKGKLPTDERRYAIESGTWATDENAKQHFIQIDEHVKRMGASLHDFIVENTATIE
ncbi:DUF4468 domain-containing protein [Larkinella sp.]|uniref:DUF4468 domain-containing protein n=1 Tax=Larkinella sp. TaxID=2034517 RepID=UPI003BA9669F